VTNSAPTNAAPPSPAAERNAWNNIPGPERIASDRQRGQQIMVITTAMILLGIALVAVILAG
jgi:hypothetical protein